MYNVNCLIIIGRPLLMRTRALYTQIYMYVDHKKLEVSLFGSEILIFIRKFCSARVWIILCLAIYVVRKLAPFWNWLVRTKIVDLFFQVYVDAIDWLTQHSPVVTAWLSDMTVETMIPWWFTFPFYSPDVVFVFYDACSGNENIW